MISGSSSFVFLNDKKIDSKSENMIKFCGCFGR